MKFLRAFIALLVVAAAAATIVRVLVPRLRCNRDKGIVNTWTAKLERDSSGDERTAKANELAALCRRCVELYPDDYEFHLLLGLNQKFLDDAAGAEQSFRRSLALNERPETYAYLAVLQLEQGRLNEARENLYHAALFNLAVVELVSDPMRSEVAQAVIERHKQLGSNVPLEPRQRRRQRSNVTVPNV